MTDANVSEARDVCLRPDEDHLDDSVDVHATLTNPTRREAGSLRPRPALAST